MSMEIEDDSVFFKPKEKSKRRSSFFQRRLSSFNPDFGSPTSETTSVSLENQSPNTSDNKITEYINKVKKEKENWINVYEKLKKENSSLKEKTPEVLDHAASLEYLSEDAKKFLQDRPDYTRIGRLLDSTAEAVARNQRKIANTAVKLNNLIDDLDREAEEMTARIIKRTLSHFDELDLDFESDIEPIEHH